MKETCGQSGLISSNKEDLQLSLENKLRRRLAMAGMIEQSVTWKVRTTQSGRRYFQRQVKVHGLSVIDFGSLPTPSGTSNHGKNHVHGRLDEWSGSTNPFRGTSLGRVHCPGFELYMMGFPDWWRLLMPLEMR